MKVLDLDMDYFMRDIANTPFSVMTRLAEEEFGNLVWSKNEVINFLENNLGLSKNNKIPGRIITGHNEALFFWEELMLDGKLQEPFEVVHIDSHADLGLGCPSSSFLQNTILTMPVEERRKIKSYEFNGEIEEINIGDYLLWGIAYKMFSKIIYCANPYGDKNDYCWDTLKDFKEELIWDVPVSNYIQLKFNDRMQMPKYNDSVEYKKMYFEGAIKDPEVELKIIPSIENVAFQGDFDFAVIAQSPNYTPASADFILDIFKEYIIEI